MALEDDLMTELKACCPRVMAMFAPSGTQAPYVTWQHAGGQSLRWADNTAATKKLPLIQVNTWAATPAQAYALMQQIEDRLCSSILLNVDVQGEPTPSFDDADLIPGYIQTFKVLGDR